MASKKYPKEKTTGKSSKKKALKEIERSEKKDRHLWLLSIIIILTLTFFIVMPNLIRYRGLPLDFFKEINFLDPYLVGSIILVLLFGIYSLVRSKEIRRLRREIFNQRDNLEHMVGTLEEITAFFQISSMISAHKDLPQILDLIARESVYCLRANRSSFFLLEENGILRNQFTFAPHPQDGQVNLFEEKEIARKAIKQGKSFLLNEAKDFSDFFKYEERERKITSLVNTPLSSQGKSIGVLSVVLIDEDRSFSDKDLLFLSIFGNHASIALENAQLLQEVRLGKSYNGYINGILKQLSRFSAEERRRIEEHIEKITPEKIGGEESFPRFHLGEKAFGTNGEIPADGGAGTPHQLDLDEQDMLRVEFEDGSLAFAEDLTPRGAFIPTANPMELGEQFPLKLRLVDSQDPIEVTCKVIWTNKYGKESQHLRRGMGVKFMDLSEESQKQVEEFIQSSKKIEPEIKVGKTTVGLRGRGKKR